MHRNNQDILPGDTVKCLTNKYKSYSYSEHAVVRDLDLSSAYNPVLILDNYLCDYGTSQYSLENWAFVSRPKPKEEPTMPTEKTKYFGVKLNPDEGPSAFIPLTEDMTVPFDTASEVMDTVTKHVANGESWIILKTVALVEPKEPVVPTKVTYYK